MKKIFYIVLSAFALASCVNLKTGDPYSEALYRLVIEPSYPDDFPSEIKGGATITVTDRNRGNSYTQSTKADGNAEIELPAGSYRVSYSSSYDGVSYNGSVDKVILDGSRSVSFSIRDARSGKIVFKEIYCGGCTKYPEEGTYNSDSYVILHNNTSEVQYLDGLCFGAVDPYNAGSSNVWVTTDPVTGETIYPDFVPVVQAVWQIGGNGTRFPLEPGKDAVIVVYGAIDHAATYPNSVNLNNSDYFVCYNSNYFNMTSYHPAPGNNIQQERILDVVVKLGEAKAYTLSQISPAVVIFRTPEGTTMREFVQQESSIIQKPGSAKDRIVKLPIEWVVDGVEVFQKGGANKKRLCPDIDAGAIDFTAKHEGHTLFRNTDKEATAVSGFEVLMDTNNSTKDFYEREKQSLHE